MLKTDTALPRVMAMARPAQITTPVRTAVSAFQKPEAFDRWNAGIHAAKGDEGGNVITVYDVIGEDYWTGGGVTVNRIDAALRKIGSGNPVEVHINSPGGDMFEGIAIYNRLREHDGEITVKVMGLAASAASIIAMAGDKVLIGAASFLMIHNCWVMAIGNRHDMAETAKFLEPFDSAMATVYSQRTGKTVDEMAKLMDNETWLNGSAAVEQGFADELLPSDAIAEDEQQTEDGRELNALRQAEISLCKAGHSRTAARAMLNKIKGTPDAAIEPTPGAGETDAITALIASMKS
jgi:ATP-dependent Clp protease protease subunit